MVKKACSKNIKQNNKLPKLHTPSFPLPIVPSYPPSLAESISALTGLQWFSSFSNNEVLLVFFYHWLFYIYISLFCCFLSPLSTDYFQISILLTFPFVRKWIRCFCHVSELNWCLWNSFSIDVYHQVLSIPHLSHYLKF